MLQPDQKIKALEQDIAFLEAELEAIGRRKEVAEIFEDRLTVANCGKDWAEIAATLQRMQHDLAVLKQKHYFATLIR
ncbi:hypothetical protein HUW51_10150 [Adhaeribacter swui]|uniref:Uncharacterized protein n=1 Tax=Adhaeribacter swui TaxID=2086471 RepID=A0A7G7G7D9_9BACT|nr:hypothetical protein [Adhaeribacter swui]QNF33073.1 hypothetical protein HUW51_10150 [Adhaeribacter swui]